jgi:hypothetical protein
MSKYQLGTWKITHVTEIDEEITTEIHVHTQSEAKFIVHNFEALRIYEIEALDTEDIGSNVTKII